MESCRARETTRKWRYCPRDYWHGRQKSDVTYKCRLQVPRASRSPARHFGRSFTDATTCGRDPPARHPVFHGRVGTDVSHCYSIMPSRQLGTVNDPRHRNTGLRPVHGRAFTDLTDFRRFSHEDERLLVRRKNSLTARVACPRDLVARFDRARLLDCPWQQRRRSILDRDLQTVAYGPTMHPPHLSRVRSFLRDR